MKPEEQRSIIAKECLNIVCEDHGNEKRWFYQDSYGTWWPCHKNDPLLDLNALHEAEKFLDEEQDDPIAYWEALEVIVGCKDSDNGNEMKKVICAKVAHRAEALAHIFRKRKEGV